MFYPLTKSYLFDFFVLIIISLAGTEKKNTAL
jgi:hypothetical protein